MIQKKLNAGYLELNIHGMTAYQAKIRIDSQLKKADKSIYRIKIIHGFHGGTTLKEMVYKEYVNNPKVIRIENGPNDGITELILREL